MASLIYIDECQQRNVYPLPFGRLVLGRGSQVDLRLDDDSVSTEHASISYENAEYVIRDLHSLNGTFVNGQKVLVHVLKNNDMIRIRDHLFLVNLTEEGAPPVQALPAISAVPQPSRVTIVARPKVVSTVKAVGGNMSYSTPRFATQMKSSSVDPTVELAILMEKQAKKREMIVFVALGILCIVGVIVGIWYFSKHSGH